MAWRMSQTIQSTPLVEFLCRFSTVAGLLRVHTEKLPLHCTFSCFPRRDERALPLDVLTKLLNAISFEMW